MNEEKQANDSGDNLFKSVLEELHWLTRKQILLYYYEKDIIPIIEQLKNSGVDLAKVNSYELIEMFEQKRLPKKQNFASWMLGKHGKPKQPHAKI